MDTDHITWVVKNIVPIVPLLALFTGLPADVIPLWSNFRTHAKRLQIIDLATKRIAFWDQFLKVTLAATDSDTLEQQSSKDKAYRAINQAHSDAVLQMEILALPEKRKQPIVGWRGYIFRPSQLRSLGDKFMWWYDIFCSAAFAVIGFSTCLFLINLAVKGHVLKTMDAFILDAIALGAFVAARWFLTEAERLKLPLVPNPPLLDEI